MNIKTDIVLTVVTVSCVVMVLAPGAYQWCVELLFELETEEPEISAVVETVAEDFVDEI